MFVFFTCFALPAFFYFPSYQLSCANTTSALLLTYSTADCSGSPISTSDYPGTFGCTAAGTSSYNMVCVSGEFTAPTPAGNVYAYNGISACPPAGGDLTTVLSYPCGTCIDYSGGYYASYSCDSSSVNLAYYTDSTCSGTPMYSGPVESTGCAATSTQVTVTECDMGNTVKGESAKEMPAAIKAVEAAAQAVQKEALIKVKESLAAALA